MVSSQDRVDGTDTKPQARLLKVQLLVTAELFLLSKMS